MVKEKEEVGRCGHVGTTQGVRGLMGRFASTHAAGFTVPAEPIFTVPTNDDDPFPAPLNSQLKPLAAGREEKGYFATEGGSTGHDLHAVREFFVVECLPHTH